MCRCLCCGPSAPAGAGGLHEPSIRGSARRNQSRRHRLGDGGHHSGAAHDPSGHCAVLCRNGAQEECAQHHGKRGGDRGRGEHSLAGAGLFAGVHAGQRLDRIGLARLVCRARVQRRAPQCGGQPSRAAPARGGIRDVPAGLRGDHCGGAGRRLGGTHAFRCDAGVRRAVEPAGLCADRSLGVGAGDGSRAWGRSISRAAPWSM